MNLILRLFLSAVVGVGLVGCGGGTSSPPQSPSPIVPDAKISKASDYTGNWSGSYATSGGTAIPITLSLVGADATSSVTGNVYSTNISGPFTGAFDGTGNIAGTVANVIDGHSWTVQLGILGSTLSITKATYGAASLGTGSCTATPALAVNMSGSWKGTIIQTNVDTGFTILGTTQNVNLELAYDGAGGFIGAIVSDQGLAARVRFQALAGYWACYIDQASSWGTMMPTPQYGTVLTEGMIVSTAEMQQSFAANSTSPTGMSDIVLSDTSWAGTYAPNGAQYTNYSNFLMTLTR